jgi:hypothetical protein
MPEATPTSNLSRQRDEHGKGLLAQFAQLRFNTPNTHLPADTPVTMPIVTSPKQNVSEVEIERAIRSGIERYLGYGVPVHSCLN